MCRVIGYQTEELPAFYTRKSGFKVDYRMDTPAEIAEAFRAKMELGLDGQHAGDQSHSRGVLDGSRCHLQGH